MKCLWPLFADVIGQSLTASHNLEPTSEQTIESPRAPFPGRGPNWLGWVVFIAYFLFLTTFLLLPDPFWFLGRESQSKVVADSDAVGYLMHGVAFGILMILLLNAQPRRSLPAWITSIVSVVVFAAATEFVQGMVPARSASLLDFGADVLGAGLGVVAWRLFLNRLKPSPRWQ